MSLSTWITDRRQEGEPIQAGEWTIVPIARAFIIQIPGLRGGLVFNRPSALRVSRADEPARVIPVVDVTRLTILGIGMLAFLAAILARILIGKDQK
jgi:hypothetical protein